MRAIIDMGSNTMRLSIYHFKEGIPELVLSKKKMVGLASYINKAGLMTDEGIQAALKALNEFKFVLNNLNIRKKYVIATAAIRNALNQQQILDTLRKKTRLNIELISGEDEALYDLKGVLLMEKFDEGIILDIGGGSTELVIYEDAEVKNALSLPIGSLNSYMKYVDHLIPTKKEKKKIEAKVLKLLEPYDIQIPEGYTMYGVGGTLRGALKLAKYHYGDSVSNHEISFPMLKELIRSNQPNKKDLVPILQSAPERIHTITTGMIIAKTIMKKYQSKLIIVNYYGLREGYIYSKFTEEKLRRQQNAKK
ncbi:MAG: phosphatase [Acholeplasmataceae bacterium]